MSDTSIPLTPSGTSDKSGICQKAGKKAARSANDQHLRSFYDNSPIAYHSLDAEGRFIEVNPSWLQLLGYTREEVIGHWAGDFLVPEQVALFRERFPRFKEVGEIHKVPFDFVRKDGSIVAIEVDGRIAYDEQGVFRRTHCVLHDVTLRKRAEQMSQALRIKENQYRELFESGSDALLLIAINTGKLIDANNMASVLYGYTRDELLTKLSTELSAEPEETSRRIKETLTNQGQVVNIPLRLHRKKDGTIFPVEITARSFLQDGEPVLLVACRDITARKQAEVALEKQNNLLTTLLNNLQIGVYMVAVPSGEPLLANQASFNLLGRGILPETNASTLSKAYDVYKSGTHEPYPSEKMPIVAAMSGVSKYVDDMTVVKPDGTQVALEVYGSPIKDSQGNIWASLVSFQDITERKQAAEAVIQLAQAKNKFIAVVSHELRSPLATIKEATSLVLEGVLGPLNDEQKDMLDIAKSNIDRLGRLVNNVLTYQKMDSCKMLYDFLENDVNEIIQEACRNAILAASERKEDLVMNLAAKPPRIRCDKDKIMQVLLNLISNGVKYSERGPIMIETHLNTQEIEFRIRDSGQGIYPEEIATIFMPFSQGRGRKTGGTGLGLAISKEIVLAHNGKIWVESERGKGSTFYFTLPF